VSAFFPAVDSSSIQGDISTASFLDANGCPNYSLRFGVHMWGRRSRP